MIHFMVLLLIGIPGAYLQCDDTGRINCYVALSQNSAIVSKETLCKELPKTQKCVSDTNCPITSLDNYLKSLIKSCGTKCDLYESIECSKLNSSEPDLCLKLKQIKDCYSTNNCEQVVKDNPNFFLQCGGDQTKEKIEKIYGESREGSLFRRIKERLRKEKFQSTSTEQTNTTTTTTANATTPE